METFNTVFQFLFGHPVVLIAIAIANTVVMYKYLVPPHRRLTIAAMLTAYAAMATQVNVVYPQASLSAVIVGPLLTLWAILFYSWLVNAVVFRGKLGVAEQNFAWWALCLAQALNTLVFGTGMMMDDPAMRAVLQNGGNVLLVTYIVFISPACVSLRRLAYRNSMPT